MWLSKVTHQPPYIGSRPPAWFLFFVRLLICARRLTSLRAINFSDCIFSIFARCNKVCLLVLPGRLRLSTRWAACWFVGCVAGAGVEALMMRTRIGISAARRARGPGKVLCTVVMGWTVQTSIPSSRMGLPSLCNERAGEYCMAVPFF